MNEEVEKELRRCKEKILGMWMVQIDQTSQKFKYEDGFQYYWKNGDSKTNYDSKLSYEIIYKERFLILIANGHITTIASISDTHMTWIVNEATPSYNNLQKVAN